MSARVTPYLNFAGNARAAMEFYHSVFGGTLDFTTYADLRRAADAGQENLVAHSMLKGATGVVLMGSDTTAPDPHAARADGNSRKCAGSTPLRSGQSGM
ncbi:VOC family protein, partial [Streptomyces sp. NPDC006875]|uniref:VOC family protein n=1 Tax=Streptomyces sp. NPDC006875 TaxID=3154781 RepID=UPI0033EB45A0